MRLRWSSKGYSDLERLHEFLERLNPQAAARATARLVRAPERLLKMPRIGVHLEEYGARDVRRILVDAYEIQYEIQNDEILVLRIWHVRESR